MDETPQQAEKRLRLETAKLEDDVDHDWKWCEDNIDQIEQITEGLPDGMIKNVLGLVVVQVHLNGMRRAWEEINDAGGSGEVGE